MKQHLNRHFNRSGHVVWDIFAFPLMRNPPAKEMNKRLQAVGAGIK
jgi:hypothetical protein